MTLRQGRDGDLTKASLDGGEIKPSYVEMVR